MHYSRLPENNNEILIMAPAGSFESLQAALDAGAGSIYFGVDRMNMRSRSSVNFTINDLGTIADLCRNYGVKSCLTVNTLLYDDDMPLMKEIVTEAKKQGISALIVSDMAAIDFASKSGMEIHLSTQMNISNIETVRFYSQYADVMVLARELTLDQVKYISEMINSENIKGPSGNKVRLEVFVHGALCMAISGKCYLSLHETGFSANRGACLQLCRRAYTVREKETGLELDIDNEYIMSPADLCTIHFLNKIIDSGVSVLKIEGRARPPEYVKTVTECYKEAVNSILEDKYSENMIIQWQKRLSTVFNRGFWDGYYLGRKLGEWSHVYGSKATHKKVYAGKAVNYYSNIGVAEFLIETGSVSEGDEILIIGPVTGVIQLTLGEIRNDNGRAAEIGKGEKCAFKVDKEVKRSDKLYKFQLRES
jgi:U32 family peptidase